MFLVLFTFGFAWFKAMKFEMEIFWDLMQILFLVLLLCLWLQKPTLKVFMALYQPVLPYFYWTVLSIWTPWIILSVINWTVTSFKIQHSPDFQKPGCGKGTIWFDWYCPFKQFSTAFFKAWNSWIQFLFYFFLEHHLNKNFK